MTRGSPPTVAEDRATRQLAQCEFETPLVVEAGAGTGKTALLVARVVAWCMGEGWSLHDDPERTPNEVARQVIERVVAITFTEAAAAEMARKIGEAFAAFSHGKEPVGWEPDLGVMPPTREECRIRAGLLADEVHRLTVSTIHGFCQRLLSTYPLEAGLHPRFVVDADEESVGALVVDVVEEALRALDRSAVGEDWEVLAGAGIDPPQIAETVQHLVTNGMSASDLERDPFTEDRARSEAAELARSVHAFVVAEAGRLDALPKNSTTSIAARDAIRGLVPMLESLGDSPTFAEIADAAAGCGSKALGRIKDWGSGIFGSTEQKHLGDGVEAVAAAADDAFRVLGWLSKVRPVEFNSARQVMVPLLREVEKRRTANGIVSFADLLHRAADLVEKSPGTVRELCSEIDQLLVDEFQDTDAVQCRLIEAMAFGDHDAPGLFVVGDPKQSIYAWRNADLAAYRKFVAKVEAHGGGCYPLVQNFRSVEPILDEVGHVVGEVMVEEDDVQPPFVPLLPTGDRIGASGFARGERTAVEYWVAWPPRSDGKPPAPSKSGETTAFEAETIARDIVELVRLEGVRWGDIAILLRATTAQEDLLEAFRKLGVPYEVAREKEFYKQREVVEAAALLRCVLDPADRLALLTAIRSDVVGVPDVALAPLWDAGFPDVMARLGGEREVGLDELDSAVARAAATTPKDPPAAGLLNHWPISLRGAARTIARLRLSFEEDPPDHFVERVRTSWLAEISASARFLGRFRRARLDRFYSDFERRLAKGEGGIPGLARYLREAVKEGQIADVKGEPDLRANAVHVMSIHGAKGLDFDHVYLMQVHRKSSSVERRADPKVLPFEGDREYRIFGWPTPDFSRAEELKNRQSKAETIRLLYVAMTRAKERLVVSGGWNEARGDKDPLVAANFADLVGGQIDAAELAAQNSKGQERRIEGGNHTQWVIPAHGRRDEEEHAENAVDFGLKNIDEARREAEILADRRASASRRMARTMLGRASSLHDQLADRHEEEEGSVPVVFESDGGVAKAVGSAVHRMLENLTFDGDLGQQLLGMLDEAEDELRFSVDHGSVGMARERLRSVVETAARGACLKRLAEVTKTVIGREVAVAATPEGEDGPVGAVTGFVDLIYRDPSDGSVVVADYKTDVVADDDAVHERARFYQPQVRTYARALKTALDLEEAPHTELWFLAADRIVRF